MARGNFAGVRYELDELFKLSTMGRKPKAKKGSFASENAGFGLRKDTAEEPGAGPEPACSQTSTGAMNLPCACVGGGGVCRLYGRVGEGGAELVA